MIRNTLNTIGINKTICILLAAVLAAGTVQSQDRDHIYDRDKYDSIAAKYKNEHAVYTNITEQLVIKEVNGKLKANSYITLEKLFISNLSLNNENMDYFYYSDFHKLGEVSGTKYMPEGNSYKKVASNDFAVVRPRTYVFYDDNRAQVVLYSGLQKNAVTETKYSLEHTDLNMLEPFLFQDIAENLPIASATYEVIAPKYVDMKFILKGENTGWISQTKEDKFGNVVYRFTATDVPAPRKFSNVPGWRYIIPHVVPLITSYKFPDAPKAVQMLENTDGLYKNNYRFVRNVNIKVSQELTSLVNDITKNDHYAKDKAAHIYQWVQENIHYIAFEKGLEGFVPREADTVLKRKYGDCKDMSSILVAMCRVAGLDAYFATVGTNTLPYDHEEIPSPMLYNHMLCALKMGDNWTFMDATDPTLLFGENREDIQGKQALIYLNAKDYKIVTLPIEEAAHNSTYDSTVINLMGYKVVGSSTTHYKGHEAGDLNRWFMNNKVNEDKDKMVRKLTKRGSNKYSMDNYSLMTVEGMPTELSINTKFTLMNYSMQVGKDYYVNMNLNRHFENNLITEPDRKVACYLDYKQKTKEVVVMDVPEGYHVTYIPKNVQGGKDGLWKYSITYTTDTSNLKYVKRITLNKEYELDTLRIGQRQFAENNKMIDDLKKYYKESVVMSKKK